jgi:ribosome recycling factor
MLEKIVHEAEEKMKKAVEFTRQELAKLRTGKATLALLDDIRIDYYGQKLPVAQVATLNTPDAHLITIQPWDKSILAEIEKAIQAANIGLNPANDGTMIRLPVPPLTEERRKEIVKIAKKFIEDGKISVRNIRRDSMSISRKLKRTSMFPRMKERGGRQSTKADR